MQCHGHGHWQWHFARHPWTGAAGTWALLGRLVPVGALGQLQWGQLNPGQPLAEPSPILQRLELEDPL